MKSHHADCGLLREALRQAFFDARRRRSRAAVYVGMLTVHTPALLLALQLLNAIYIGILAGIGMLYFQDLMPGQAGSATTLYTNTTRVGWIIAGSLAGVVAEIWNYHTVFWIALVMCVMTLSCLTRIKDV